MALMEKPGTVGAVAGLQRTGHVSRLTEPDYATFTHPTRGEIVARHIPGIAAAVARTAETIRNDGLLAFALRGHAGELLDAADLIDRPWTDRTRDLLARVRLGEPMTMRMLLDALDTWPGLDGATDEEPGEALRQALANTGQTGRAAVEALLMEVANG